MPRNDVLRIFTNSRLSASLKLTWATPRSRAYVQPKHCCDLLENLKLLPNLADEPEVNASSSQLVLVAFCLFFSSSALALYSLRLYLKLASCRTH